MSSPCYWSKESFRRGDNVVKILIFSMYLPLYYSSFRHTFLFQFPSVFFWLSSVFYSFRGSSCFCLFFVGFLGFFFFLSGVRWGSGFFFFWLLHWFAALFLYSLAVRTCWLGLFVWCDGCLNDTSHLLIGCPGLSRNFVHTRTCGATCAVRHDLESFVCAWSSRQGSSKGALTSFRDITKARRLSYCSRRSCPDK